MLEGSYQLGLSDLLDQNLSCYEYFHSLPEDLQKRIAKQDIGSFEEMQDFVANLTGPRMEQEPEVRRDQLEKPGALH